jgi:hypothetical protein
MASRIADFLHFPCSLELSVFPEALQEPLEALLTPDASKTCWLSGCPPLLREAGKVTSSEDQPSFLPSNRSMLRIPRIYPRQQQIYMDNDMVEQEAEDEHFALLQSLLCPSLDAHLNRQDWGLAKRNLSQTETESIQLEAATAAAGAGSTNESKEEELLSISKKTKSNVHDSRFKLQQPAIRRDSSNATCA